MVHRLLSVYIYFSEDRRLSIKVFAIKERWEACYSLEWLFVKFGKEQDCVRNQRYKLNDCNSVHILESSGSRLFKYTHTKKATIMKREIEGQYKQYCQWDWRTQIGFVIACLIAACI